MLAAPREVDKQFAREEVFLSPLRDRADRRLRPDHADKRPDTRIVVLLPLNRRQIERFATALGLADPLAFVAELHRRDAWNLARCPFDRVGTRCYL